MPARRMLMPTATTTTSNAKNSSCSATNNPATVTRIQAYNTSTWLSDLSTLAGMSTSLGLNNVIGIDIYNEPWDYTWSDWSSLANQAYSTINGVNPNLLIFMEGTSDTANNQDGISGNEVTQPYGADPAPNWGGNLFSAGANPPSGIPKSRIVFTPHVYGISVFVGKEFVDNTVPACVGLSGDDAGNAKCPLIMPSVSTLRAGWDAQWGYLKAQGYAVVIGEWGGNFSWPGGKASLRDQNRYSYVTNHTIDQQWQSAFVDYLLSKCILDNVYWSINPESGDTGGLYTTPYDPVSNTGGWGTWGSLDSAKMTMVHRLWDAPACSGGTPQPTSTTGPSLTPTKTATRTNTPVVTPALTATKTRTPTAGPSLTPTRTNTAPAITLTPTRTSTPFGTPTSGGTGGACSPVTSTVTAPFTFDGAGVFCWQIATIPSYVNDWNTNTVSINGTSFSNVYVAAGSLPAKIGGFYYISYNGSFAWSHIEIR